MGIGKVVAPILEEAVAKTGPLLQDFKNYFVKSGYKVLEDMGEGGTMLSNMLKSSDTQKSILAGSHIADFKNIADQVPIQTRLQVGLNPQSGSQIAPQFWNDIQNKGKAIATDLASRGAKVVTVAGGQLQRVPIYYPQDFMPKVLSQDVFKLGTVRNELIDHLTNTQQFPSRADAEHFVTQMKGMMFGRRGVEIMHDLGGLNVPAKFLENDPKIAFSAWAESASNYITKSDNFGPKNQNLKTLIDVIKAETDSDSAVKFAKDAVDAHEYGYGHMGRSFYEGVTPTETWLRNFEGLTKLSRVFIAEPSQALNTLLFTNAKSFASSIADSYGKNAKDAVDFALRSGALASEALRDFRAEVHGRDSWASSLLHYTGFDYARKMNIIVAANAGKHYAQDLTEDLLNNRNLKEANIMLKSLGLEPSAIYRQGGLLPEDLLTAGRKAAETTQFFHDPLQLPIQWSKNPAMRTMSLYKNYAYNQTKFLKNQIFTRDALDSGKIPSRLAYMAVLYPVVGELVGDMEGLMRGQSPSDRPSNSAPGKILGEDHDVASRYLDNLTRVGTMGMFFSMLGSINRGNVTNWIGGPLAGDIEDAAKAGYYLAKGNPKYAAQTAANRVPVVGGIISSKIRNK